MPGQKPDCLGSLAHFPNASATGRSFSGHTAGTSEVEKLIERNEGCRLLAHWRHYFVRSGPLTVTVQPSPPAEEVDPLRRCDAPPHWASVEVTGLWPLPPFFLPEVVRTKDFWDIN
ncbi:hypothetical protein A2567_03110 [Candidatus Azambacteria bacterium RIFOXYD1_FULL_42_11]|uniref:Uncharacterized protein n=1 Tax=Candidatus Azambacteria bacterium RIFOXYD1_FULL_42_11 TaxID=1797310 RepID=A0A1F5CGN6_9BACT|nr:MAG: hypothetical protein A2567_03110 [Candidatus Azambacteria bacterium RIFOXYD1_FULL_42_11]